MIEQNGPLNKKTSHMKKKREHGLFKRFKFVSYINQCSIIIFTGSDSISAPSSTFPATEIPPNTSAQGANLFFGLEQWNENLVVTQDVSF